MHLFFVNLNRSTVYLGPGRISSCPSCRQAYPSDGDVEIRVQTIVREISRPPIILAQFFFVSRYTGNTRKFSEFVFIRVMMSRIVDTIRVLSVRGRTLF